MNRPDILLTNHGSICLFRAFTKLGEGWLDENLSDENQQYWGDAVVCEPRCVAAIDEGAINDGLTVGQA